jgi:hypothetical protein
MKHLKMLGLAVIAALAFAAVVGASTASAAALCKTAPNKSGVCEGGKYPSGTEYHSTSTNAVLTVVGSAVVSTVSCSHSTVVLKQTAESGATSVPGEVTDVTFTECKTNSGTACTVSTTSGYTGGLTPTTDTGNGTLNVKGSGTSTETTVTCGGFFQCKYRPTSSGLSLGFTGGNPATVTASGAALELVSGFGFGCGSGANWDATYTLKATTLNGKTTPTALWVSTS